MAPEDPRHEARRLALAVLFGKEAQPGNDIQELEECALDSLDLKDGVNRDKTKNIVEGVIDNQKLIDDIIETTAPEWPLEQINKIDLICLRMAVFELIIFQNTPHKVCINEAVELAKEFGGETSGKFVNGVLGTITQILMPEKAGATI